MVTLKTIVTHQILQQQQQYKIQTSKNKLSETTSYLKLNSSKFQLHFKIQPYSHKINQEPLHQPSCTSLLSMQSRNDITLINHNIYTKTLNILISQLKSSPNCRISQLRSIHLFNTNVYKTGQNYKSLFPAPVYKTFNWIFRLKV